MKKRNKAAAFFIGVCRFILVVVMAASLFAATVSVFLNNTLFNENYYKQQLTSDEYISEINGYIGKAIKSSCLYYGLPYDEIVAVITDESVKEISGNYAEALYKSLKNGTQLAEINYPSENIKKVLEDFFEKENADIDDETVQLIADDLAGTVSANIVAIKDSYGSINLFKPVSKYVFSNKYVQMTAQYWMLITALCVFLTVLTLSVGASTMRKRLYTTANVYWLAGCIMFIPVLVFNNHDIFSKIALNNSPVKSFIDSIGKPMLHNLLRITTVVFVIACVLLVLAVIAFISAMVKRHKEKKEAEKDADNDDISESEDEEADDNEAIKPEEDDASIDVTEEDIDDIVNEIYKSSAKNNK